MDVVSKFQGNSSSPMPSMNEFAAFALEDGKDVEAGEFAEDAGGIAAVGLQGFLADAVDRGGFTERAGGRRPDACISGRFHLPRAPLATSGPATARQPYRFFRVLTGLPGSEVGADALGISHT
jgi:hypothetical protein